MLKSIRSNRASFKRVDFRAGYNIILADRFNKDNEDDKKKTRNGAGKSTLVDIIHFCLGAQVDKGSIFKLKELEGWSFTLEFNIGNFDFEIERCVDAPSKIILHRISPRLDWDTKSDKETNLPFIAPSAYNKELQSLFFGLSKNDMKYVPSFRELISYYIRRNLDGYRNAFEFWKSQPEHNRQSCNAYFLDLNIDFISKFQKLKEEAKKIEEFRKAAASGVIGTFTLDSGKLETEVINRKTDAEQMKKQLDSFHVHPQYNEIANTANTLTAQIHEASNDLILQQQLLSRYEQNMNEEVADISNYELQRIYEEAGIIFSDRIKIQLDEVIEFHKALLSNRKDYLQAEIEKLRREIKHLRDKIERLTNERAESLQILESHGALDEYTRLQEKYSKLVQLYEDALKRKEAAAQIEERKSKIKIETQELLLLARQDYAERINTRKLAVSLFRENTEFLYQEPGILTIEIKDNGYAFDVEIKSAKSQGVNYMKVFCYDMLIMELGASRSSHPDFLIHDSTIFDGVDERQIALALLLAKKKSEEIGFQYICLINSDTIPKTELDEEFYKEFMDSVILRIDDSDDKSGLLGIRF
jgi:uncharacterized protein YydD (DUF2326 family)